VSESTGQTGPGFSEQTGPESSRSQPVPVRLRNRPTVTESAVGTPPPRPSGSGEPITITIDGRQVQARTGQWIIQAADEAGVYIPRFCYHPRMKPVGMCRMCLVEVSGPRGPSLMPACYNPVADGMEIQTSSPKAKKAQEGVLEFLLVNHPLDCPVCDKGGECPLQDQTLAYGPGESRFVEEKRHWEKPIAISDLVYLDRERCIQCGRCVRFADEVAGDPLIDFAERGDLTEVATFPDQPYSSYFSGNVVQICPVGALTAKPYRFKARPWDLEQVESTCTTCSVGCRVAVQASSGELSRLIGVDSDPVNWGWLCDKGRFGFAAWTSESRVTVPLIRRGDDLVEAGWGEALDVAAAGLAAARDAGGGVSLAVIGGARLHNEDAYAWAKAARVALATDNVDAQLADGVPAATIMGLPRATIQQAVEAPLVITVGGDIKDEVPVLYLRLRDAVREHGTLLVELTPAPTGLSRYAARSLLYRPGELAALAAALTGSGPVTGEVAGVQPDAIEAGRAGIREAQEKGRPDAPAMVVVLGRPSLAEPDDQVAAAARILGDLPGVAFLSSLRRANVHGALDMGLTPGVLPGRVPLEAGRAWYEHHWASDLPSQAGLDTAGILEAATRGWINGLVLLGADPCADFPDSRLALQALYGARFVVAVDTHVTASSRLADVVLPAAAWAERRGSFTNLEGRVTRLGQLVTARGAAWPDWVIASELAARLGVDLGFSSLEDIWDEVARVSPLHRAVEHRVLYSDAARDGLLVPPGRADPGASGRLKPLDPMADTGIYSAELHNVAPTAMLHTVVSTEPEPDGAGASGGADVASTGGPPAPAVAAGDGEDAPPGRPAMLGLPAVAPATAGGPPPPEPGSLRLVTRRTLWDGGTQVQSVPYLAELRPLARLVVHPSVLANLGTADGESVQVKSGRGSLVLPAFGDFTMPPGTVLLPWNLPGACAGDLIAAGDTVTEVRVETVSPEGGSPDG
jgi:NADH-quinone oxidoreductase subunit G